MDKRRAKLSFFTKRACELNLFNLKTSIGDIS